MVNPDFRKTLSAALDESEIRLKHEDIVGYSRDYRGLYNNEALAVCFPKSEHSIQRIIALCNQFNIAIVPQGGNSSYCGAAVPIADRPQIILNMRAMNTILEIDPINRTMLVEAGTTLSQVHQAAEAANLLFPLDLGARESAQIGGLISTNAGGINVVKYGNTRDLILGLDAVLANGKTLNASAPLRKNNSGYALSQLFAGAEGTLGVILRAQLKLFSRPRADQTILFAFKQFSDVTKAFNILKEHAEEWLHSFEYISPFSAKLTHESALTAPFPLPLNRHFHYALIQLASCQTQHFDDNVMQMLEPLMLEDESVDAVIAQSQRQQGELWRFRESIPHAERHFGASIKFDISVPISAMGQFIDEGLKILLRIAPDCRPSIYGHVGDGNVHFNALPPVDIPLSDFRKSVENTLTNELFDLAVSLNGSFSAEHGIGQLRRKEVQRYKDTASIKAMYNIKQALDAEGRFNPGKFLP